MLGIQVFSGLVVVVFPEIYDQTQRPYACCLFAFRFYTKSLHSSPMHELLWPGMHLLHNPPAHNAFFKMPHMQHYTIHRSDIQDNVPDIFYTGHSTIWRPEKHPAQFFRFVIFVLRFRHHTCICPGPHVLTVSEYGRTGFFPFRQE